MKPPKNIYLAGCGVIALTLVLGVAAFFVGAGMFSSSIIKKTLEGVLPQVTGVPVKIGDIGYSLLKGSACIEKLEIANPTDFGTGHAFKAEKIEVCVDLRSLLSQKIIIKEVGISGVDINYVQSLTSSNLLKIKGNIDRYVADRKAPPGKEKAPQPSGDGKSVVIKKLDITGGKIAVRTTAGESFGVSASLPDIHMTDVGGKGDGGGMPLAGVIREIFVAVADGVAGGIKGANLKLDGSALKSLEKSVEKDAGGLVDKIKGLF